MDQKNFAIGVLTTTAAIMFTGLIMIGTRPETASAAGMTATGGEYIMSVGTTPQTDEEYLFVIDTTIQKMVVYRFDANRANVELVQGLDLTQFRKATNAPPQPKAPPQPRTP